MIALHFGRAEAPLFGVYHPAAGARPGTQSIVVCNAFGAEYMVSHMALRRLAVALAERGHDVLRFDYSGTGDSAGEQEMISLTQWLSDIWSAAEELADMTERRSVTLVGVRLGAGLACHVAALRPDRIRRVVAWDPILRGDLYLKWLEQVERIRHPAESSEPQVAGHPLPLAFREQLLDFDVQSTADSLGSRFLRAAPAPAGELDLFKQALTTGDLIIDSDAVTAIVTRFAENRL